MYLLFHYVQYEGSDLRGWFPTMQAMIDHCEAEMVNGNVEPDDRDAWEYLYADPTESKTGSCFTMNYQKVFD